MNTKPKTEDKRGGQVWWYAIIIGLSLIAITPITEAHEGPPFPIIVDEEVGSYLVTVWTDPDIGIGTFFVVFEPKSDNEATEDIKSVKIGVEPVSGRLEEEVYNAEAQPTRLGYRYSAEVEFDKGEMWTVRVILEGEGWKKELISEVEATPDGSIGPISILIYALPFVGIGILWFRAIMVRRQKE